MNYSPYGPPSGYGPPPSPRQEFPILAEFGVHVTSARFVVGMQTYPINGITSVAPFTIPAARVGLVILGVLFGLATLGSISALLKGDGSIGTFVICGSLTAICIGVAVTRKDRHGVVITTAGMNVRALISHDGAHVGRVLAALNQAIAMR